MLGYHLDLRQNLNVTLSNTGMFITVDTDECLRRDTFETEILVIPEDIIGELFIQSKNLNMVSRA